MTVTLSNAFGERATATLEDLKHPFPKWEWEKEFWMNLLVSETGTYRQLASAKYREAELKDLAIRRLKVNLGLF